MQEEKVNIIKTVNETFNFDLKNKKDYAMREAEIMRRSMQIKRMG